MFYRKATIEISDILKQNDNKTWTWQEVVKKSTLLKKSDFLPAEAFDYDPDNFVYFRARSITANIANGNGDFFEDKELEASYKSFVGKGFYIEHDSDSIEKAKGIILDSVWYPEGKYIECLVAVDRKAYQDIARQIEAGILNSVSMGCVVEEAECSICRNIARNQHELCAHMNPMSPTYCKGRTQSDGVKAYEINRKVTFSELSGVAQPADIEAHVFEVFASVQKNLLTHAVQYQNRKAKAAGCPDGKCTLDMALSNLSPEERVALRSALDKSALNAQSPSTFQGNPAVDSGAANPKKVMDAAPSMTGGGDFVEKRRKERRGPASFNPADIAPISKVVKADALVGEVPPTPLLDQIQEETKPISTKIDETIKDAIKNKIDGLVSQEVMKQVDVLLAEMMAQVQLPIINEVSQAVQEHRQDAQQEVQRMQEEIANPPETACPPMVSPELVYGPQVMATILLDKAVRQSLEGDTRQGAYLKALYAVIQPKPEEIGIEIGPGLTLKADAQTNLLRLYRGGQATQVLLERTKTEMPETQKIAYWRESLGLDRKSDTAETPKYECQ